MQAALSTRLAAPAKVQATRPQQQRIVCSAVPQKEEQPRRAVLGLLAAAVLGMAAPAAEAVQPAAKNGSKASQAGYVMEGTRKQGISPKRKRAVLAKAKKAAGVQQ